MLERRKKSTPTEIGRLWLPRESLAKLFMGDGESGFSQPVEIRWQEELKNKREDIEISAEWPLKVHIATLSCY